MTKYVKTSVSVPLDLKAKMDTTRIPVSWSKIACEAFRREIAKAELQSSESKSMLDAIRSRSENSEESFGKTAAAEWLRGHAKFRQIAEVVESRSLSIEVIEAAFPVFPPDVEATAGFIAEVTRFWNQTKDLI